MLRSSCDCRIALIGHQRLFSVIVFVFLFVLSLLDSLCIICLIVQAQNHSTFQNNNLEYNFSLDAAAVATADSNITTIMPAMSSSTNITFLSQNLQTTTSKPFFSDSSSSSFMLDVTKPTVGFGDFRPPHDFPSSDDEDYYWDDIIEPAYKNHENGSENNIVTFDDNIWPIVRAPYRELIVGDKNLIKPITSADDFLTQQADGGELFEGCYCDHYWKSLKDDSIIEFVETSNTSRIIDSKHEVYCYCVGQSIRAIPANFSINVRKM